MDYRGEVKALIHNDSDEIKTIENESRVCQMMIIPVLDVECEEVDELSETDRGDGGFGSSGVK